MASKRSNGGIVAPTSGLRMRLSRADAPWIALASLVFVAAAAGLLWALPPEVKDPWRLIFALVGGTGAGPVVTAWLKRRGVAREARERAGERLKGGGTKPFHLFKDSELGIHAPLYDADEFLERDLTEAICERLRAEEPVLIVGPSMAGKTRLAAEAVRRSHPLRPAIVPESGDSLLKLLEQAHPEGCLIWLDDLDRFLNSGVTAERLRQLMERRNLVVATMRTSERTKLIITNDVKPFGSDILEVFGEVALRAELTTDEKRRLKSSAYSPLSTSIESFGLAAYLGGAPNAWTYFTSGEETHPLGWARVRAGVDWYRATREPIPERVLEDLAPAYLPSVHKHSSFSRSEQMEWTAKLLNASVSLLIPAPMHSWRVFDYILDRLTTEGAPVRSETWAAVLSAGLPERVEIQAALAAYNQGDGVVAEELWGRAISSGGDSALGAGLNLGLLRQEAGEYQAAEVLFRAALDAPDHHLSALAAFHVASVREVLGDRAEAETYYQKAMESNDRIISGSAANRLATLYFHDGKSEEAERCLRFAAKGADSKIAAGAAINLGTLYKNRGDINSAEEFFQQAAASEDTEVTALASAALGQLRKVAGDSECAVRLLRKAVDSGVPEAAAAASLDLAGIKESEGDIPGAIELYKIALKTGDDTASGSAAFSIGRISMERGDINTASEMYLRIARGKDTKASEQAKQNLGILSAQQGNTGAATEIFEGLMNSTDSSVQAAAAVNLGQVMQDAGDISAAANLYKRGLESDVPDASAQAARNLGRLRFDAGDLAGAENLYLRAIHSNNSHAAAVAQFELAELYSIQGKHNDARKYFEMARKSTHPKVAEAADRRLQAGR